MPRRPTPATAAQHPRLYRATDAFCCPGPNPGQLYIFAKDPLPKCLIAEGHWVLKAHPELFEEFDVDEFLDGRWPDA
jgi:hypothetical protein